MHNKSADRRAQIARGAALARPEIGAVAYTKTSERMPEDGQLCMVWADMDDGLGAYRLPFVCVRRAGVWHNAKMGFPLEVRIVGWNPASAPA